MTEVLKISEIRGIIKAWKDKGFSIGLVPTMGFLHDGHLSLIQRARKQNDKVVVSVFVNPTQFGPNEDFDAYPRDIKKDLQRCESAGVDVVFAPAVADMYPSENKVYIDVEELGNGLCGAARPGHFRGVCTVVAKLFNIVKPDRAYFGEKDAQQLAIIKRMVYDLNFDVEIISCPIVREPDGLAMSSRNAYLSQQERAAALILSRALGEAKQLLLSGERDSRAAKQLMTDMISNEPLARIDYIEIVDAMSLVPVEIIKQPVLVALAVYIGKTRLIDNFTFTEV